MERPLSSAPFPTREAPRKATPIYDRFRSFPLDFEPASIVQFLSSAPPRATWLARGLETGHRGNGGSRDSDRLLIDANFSIHPRDSTTLGDRISFGTGKNLGEIRFDRERRIFVIALLRLLRLFVYHSPLSRSIDGSNAHGCNTLAMIYFLPKEKCSRAGAIDASINYRASSRTVPA